MRTALIKELSEKIEKYAKYSTYLQSSSLILIALFWSYEDLKSFSSVISVITYLFCNGISSKYLISKKELNMMRSQSSDNPIKQWTEKFVVVILPFTLWAPLTGFFLFSK